ncbi:MAG: hypothetical protein GX139_09880 [Armatimonadetes bacterium]|jgi:hypothetical protein|nr:hypothetical protein [Armatimonadota bacterium]
MQWHTDGQFSIGNYTFQAEVEVVQKFADDGGIFLDMTTNQPIARVLGKHSPIKSEGDGSPYTLQATDIITSTLVTNNKMSIRTFHTKLISPNLPSDSEEVTFKAYIANAYDMLVNHRQSVDISIGSIPAKITRLDGQPISHQIVFKSVPYSKKWEINTLVGEICWLISLAVGNLVAVACLETESNDGIVEVDVRYPNVFLRSMFPLFDIDSKSGLIKLLSALSSFRRHNICGFLSHLAHLLLLARNSQYPQIRTLLLANFLEVIRFHQGMNYVNSSQMKLEDDNFEWRCGLNAGKRATFRQLLKDFCDMHKITTGLDVDCCVNIRNEIMHTGKLKGSFEDGYQRCLWLHEFCDRIVMALLDWDTVQGHYYRIDDPSPNGSTAKIKFER